MLFGLSSGSSAAESSAAAGRQHAIPGVQPTNFLLAASGSPQTPPKKGTTKHRFKRKSTKSPHAKTKSLHGKMGRKKGTSSHRGKKTPPPGHQKSGPLTT
jgi:hypothetical protein